MNFSYRGRLRAFWVYSWELGWWELLGNQAQTEEVGTGCQPRKRCPREAHGRLCMLRLPMKTGIPEGGPRWHVAQHFQQTLVRYFLCCPYLGLGLWSVLFSSLGGCSIKVRLDIGVLGNTD